MPAPTSHRPACQIGLSLMLMATVGAAGCANGSSGPARTPAPFRTLAVDQSGSTIQTNSESVDRVRFTFPPDELFRTTLLAFSDIGVEPTLVDAQHRRVGNAGLIRTRTLGSVPLSRYLDCGTNISGAKADNDRVTLVIEANIEADGATDSALRVLVNATAKSMMGASTAAVECSSTGRLELLLRNAIGLRLAKR